jgi:serine/threonine protein kinase
MENGKELQLLSRKCTKEMMRFSNFKKKQIFSGENFIFKVNRFSQISHPNCVQFIGLYKSPENDLYMCMEYLSKGTLKEVLKKDQYLLSVLDLLHM